MPGGPLPGAPILPRTSRISAAFLLAAFVLAACGVSEVGAGGTPGPEPGSDLGNADVLADGSHFGFLTAVDATARTITLDEAVWVVADDEPNGYRIDNPEREDVVVPIADDATIEVLMSTGDPATATEVDAGGLEDWFTGPAGEQEVAFNLEVLDGTVSAMRFAYRP